MKILGMGAIISAFFLFSLCMTERRKAEIVAGLKGQGDPIVKYVISVLRGNTQYLMAAGAAHKLCVR